MKLMLAIMILFCSPEFSAPDKPVIHFENTTHNFGVHN